MPALERSDLRQHAVLWTAAGRDDYGNPKVASPVEIRIRWETGKGEANRRKAEVITKQEIVINSVMWLGKLANLPALPSPNVELMQVIGYDEIPDAKNRDVLRRASLVLLGSKLPTGI